MYLPYISHPTRVTRHSKTMVDNIFSNYVSKEAVCDDLTSTIFDHLPQGLFIPSKNTLANSNSHTFTVTKGKKNEDKYLIFILIVVTYLLVY